MVNHLAFAAQQAARVPRADDRKVLNGMYWRLRTGSPWADIPECCRPAPAFADRVRRWAEIRWDRVFEVVFKAYDGALHMVDGFSVRVHQHGDKVKRAGLPGDGLLVFLDDLTAAATVIDIEPRPPVTPLLAFATNVGSLHASGGAMADEQSDAVLGSLRVVPSRI
jgi:transposase